MAIYFVISEIIDEITIIENLRSTLLSKMLCLIDFSFLCTFILYSEISQFTTYDRYIQNFIVKNM